MIPGKFRSIFFTLSSLILMFLQSVNCSAVTISLGLNTKQNWLLRSWACSLEFVMSFPASLNGETPIPSVLHALMKHLDFFLEEVGFVTSSEIRCSICLQSRRRRLFWTYRFSNLNSCFNSLSPHFFQRLRILFLLRISLVS